MVASLRSDDLTPHIPDAHESSLAQESSRQLANFAGEEGDVQLRVVREGDEQPTVTLPASAFQLLRRILSELASGNAVTVVPHHAELTTQQAADALNVSRPYLVKLLEEGEIPFHRVGTHRRVRFDDVRAYKRRIDEQRRETLDELAALSQELDLDEPLE